MSQFTFTDHIASFENYIDLYLKNKSRDCILYSKDGSKFKVHKELFGQTQFLRKILSSANERCCGTIEVFCPCTKDELNHLVNFLYDGEIHCEEEFDSLKILENLNKIFGFSKKLAIKMPNDPIAKVNVTQPIAITEEAFENMSSEKPYSCQYCFKEYGKLEHLKDHELIHFGEKPYSCTYCSKTFRLKSTRKVHERIHTGEKPYPCKICNRCFSQPVGLKQHQVVHTGEKPYLCTYCSRIFSLKHQLKSHERIHTGEKPYSCKTCNKCFSQLGSLNNHKLIHTGEKPHSCTYCSQMFSSKNQLKIHERIHTPYSCKTCNKCFSQLGALKNHELIHTDEKPYSSC